MTKVIEIDGVEYELVSGHDISGAFDSRTDVYALKPVSEPPKEPEELCEYCKCNFVHNGLTHNASLSASKTSTPTREPEWEVKSISDTILQVSFYGTPTISDVLRFAVKEAIEETLGNIFWAQTTHASYKMLEARELLEQK